MLKLIKQYKVEIQPGPNTKVQWCYASHKPSAQWINLTQCLSKGIIKVLSNFWTCEATGGNEWVTFANHFCNSYAKQCKSSACLTLKLNVALNGANGPQSAEVLAWGDMRKMMVFWTAPLHLK